MIKSNRIRLLIILALVFILAFVFKNRRVLKYYSSRYGTEFNEERKELGMIQIPENWEAFFIDQDDGLEYHWYNPLTDSLQYHKPYHKNKIIYIQPTLFFWQPRATEELDVFIYRDSLCRYELNVIRAYKTVNGTDSCSLSFLKLIDLPEKSIKSLDCSRIDSVLSAWQY